MASAAAVAADQARSPISNNIGEDGGHEGEVTSAIVGKGEDVPDVNGNAEEDDEDEDLPSNPLRGAKRPRATLNADDEEEEEEGGAIFELSAVSADFILGRQSDLGVTHLRLSSSYVAHAHVLTRSVSAWTASFMRPSTLTRLSKTHDFWAANYCANPESTGALDSVASVPIRRNRCRADPTPDRQLASDHLG